ncbi:MAG: CPBP family intramembrane glutamic endopeptidase, partial [Thermoproteota archaeon]
ILGLFNLAEIAFLNQILKPVEGFLTSLGLPSSPTLGSLPKQYLFLNMVVLALFWWLEVPEELFFRGYIQNRLQGEHGKNISMLLSALIWDIWHVHGPAQCLRRFFVGLILAFAFRWRQNSYPTMLVHSIGNRVGTAIILLLR